jgi:HSP20 family protein
VKLEMPGVAKEDVKVAIEGRQVSVQARARNRGAQGRCARGLPRAFTPASYARSFTLPLEVDQPSPGAKLENGVLTLTLPKRGCPRAAQITVN